MKFTEKIKKFIFDYILVEGSSAFYRIGLALLKITTQHMHKISDLSVFLSEYQRIISNINSTGEFRSKLRKMYIDKDLLDVCRNFQTQKKQDSYSETIQSRNFGDKCFQDFPFCVWKRNIFRKDCSTVTFRAAFLQKSLKYNFFDPFGFRFHSQVLIDLKTKVENFDSERLIDNFYGKRASWLNKSLHSFETLPENAEYFHVGNFISKNLTLKKQEIVVFEKSEKKDELLINRSSHVCEFEQQDYRNRKWNEHWKMDYFYIQHKILFRYLGRTIKCYIFQDSSIESKTEQASNQNRVKTQNSIVSKAKKPESYQKTKQRKNNLEFLKNNEKVTLKPNRSFNFKIDERNNEKLFVLSSFENDNDLSFSFCQKVLAQTLKFDFDQMQIYNFSPVQIVNQSSEEKVIVLDTD